MTALLLFAGVAAAQTLPAEPADAVAPSTQPTTLPSTMPATMPATQPVKMVISRITGKALPPPPPEYAVLSTRTAFIKNRVQPPPVVQAAAPVATPPAPVARQETTLVFNGVTDVDGVGYAIFEDTVAGKILGFKVGDTIASGKITSISLDGLEYETNGKIVKVLVGQNLDGGDAPDLSSRAVVTGGATSQPSSAGNPGEDAILKALREKRRREMGQ